ncbi:MAG: gamma-glutamyltranspeptidase / glutathione hydrolase [Actinomycetota bacterium]|nr:gamma-glutamyltranspeptidase / glutathione hydrolase [Actinomycetota bacterium]
MTTHPLATRSATEVLRDGGNACDAALAASLTQSVVEPHMTTITGAFSMLYYEAATGETSYVNGTMNAPRADISDLTEHDLQTGRGAAVPGWWAGWEAARERFGTLAPARLGRDAVAHARDGFPVNPFLYGEIFTMAGSIGRSEQGREMYFPRGSLIEPGETLRQPRAADTIERLLDEGNDYFYGGNFARRLCEVAARDKGVLTPEDFAAYSVRWDEVVRGTYGDVEILAAPPPDSGGMHLIEALNILETLDLPRLGHPTESAETLFWMMRASQSTLDDGARLNDPASHRHPAETLLSKEYAVFRKELLASETPSSSSPPPTHPGSDQVTVVDGHGNCATVMHSCMALPWSNGLFVDGISICAAAGHFLRVMPLPGHRATVYTASNIVLRGGRPLMVSGSPSVSLLACVLQNIVNVVDFGMDLETSVHLPRFGNRYLAGQLIEADVDERLRAAVAARGVDIEVVNPWSMHLGTFEGILLGADGSATACADPRRTGSAEAA